MKRPGTYSQASEAVSGASPASQTLVRGLDVLEVVAHGPLALPALATRLGLARSTAHRLATALLERRYLTLVPREGYGLGPKLLELGSCAQQQTVLVRVARPYLERLAAETRDSVQLSICDAGTVLLLDRIAGGRRLLPTLRIGERQKLTDGAVGWALLMDGPEASWREAFAQDCGSAASSAVFVDNMRRFAELGYAHDPDDTDDRIRTVAAPVRGAAGTILAAIGVSSAAQYMDDARLASVGHQVARAAMAIGDDLGQPSSGFDTTQDGGAGATRGVAPGTRLTEVNNTFGGDLRAKSLEARAQPVHDPRIKTPRRADTPKRGVT